MDAPKWGAGAGKAVAGVGPVRMGAEVDGATTVSACGQQWKKSRRRGGCCGVEVEWEVREKDSAKAGQGMEKGETGGENHVESCR